ncbi:ACL128Cp [Eremothecium gossypii ATCC 10895]|uniref:ACL128Cp n=1 Tax=Eremothecium gossypii (strain ATCC 10895 / CBS 109.51 / FGSC 9923 / NRRL Y-1056) TaxID=284811 RepID=Q75CP7_EREGS|nr:ACL128Cp [Eremothecium gossypii ATCC 10895]AAS51100.1 ACL128Cp [Eremothecium gossypii ATCC 10895]
MENKLRKIPLYNAFEGDMPRRRAKLQLAALQIAPAAATGEHLAAWDEECRRVLESVQQARAQGGEWEAWYEQTYLRKQPPGLLESGTLRPRRK